MVRISAFRYLVPGKRPGLPVSVEDKAKQMGLGDCGLDSTETELIGFWLKHGVAVSTNSLSEKHELYNQVGAISGGLAERSDFLTEVKEWFLGNLNMHTKAGDQQFFDIYLLFYSGTGNEDGDIHLPQNVGNKLDAGFAQQGGSRKKKEADGLKTIISVSDIERVWEEFKKENFRITGHQSYRQRYYSKAYEQLEGPVQREHVKDGELTALELGKFPPLLWIVNDADFSNQWVERAYQRNYRDIVVQGTTDESAGPLNVFAQTWVRLQQGALDPRQFVTALKNFNGPSANPKTYAMPGFRFPSWSSPELNRLGKILEQSRWNNSRAAELGTVHEKTGKTWFLERRTDGDRVGRTAGTIMDSRFGTEHFSLQPIMLIQGRKNVMSAQFSHMQTEVLETIQELDTLRNMYADNDTRPGKDNNNNALRLQDANNSFSAQKLLYLVHTLKIYLYNPQVCFKALKCFWALTYDEEVRSDLMNAEIIKIITKIVDVHISDPLVCLYATGAISHCAWSARIWRGSPKTLETVWALLLEFLFLHAGEEELIRLVAVTLAGLAPERGPSVFSSVFPFVCDLADLYISSAPTSYALVGVVLQLAEQRVPEDSEDCVRVFALLLQMCETHRHDQSMHRQCALGMLRLSGSVRARDAITAIVPMVNLWINSCDAAIENFSTCDPYIVWLFISCLLNLIKSSPAQMKQILFSHPKARNIYRNCITFSGEESTEGGGSSSSGGAGLAALGGRATGRQATSGSAADSQGSRGSLVHGADLHPMNESYEEVLRRNCKQFVQMFRAEKNLWRQLLINEKKKEAAHS